MAVTTITYASDSAVTLTLASLADGAYRQSTVVDNNTNGYIDVQVSGGITTGTSPTADENIEIYAYADAGTDYTGGASGTDSAYTAAGDENQFKLIAVIVVNGTSDNEYIWGPVSISQAFGGLTPKEWGIVVRNNSGVALNSTGANHFVNFVGLTLEAV